MIRTAAAGVLLVLARWLLGDDAEAGDAEAGDVQDGEDLEDEGDEPTDAPCAVSFDWEGDVQSIEVLTEDPRDRLAVLMFVGQGRRILRGTESIGNG